MPSISNIRRPGHYLDTLLHLGAPYESPAVGLSISDGRYRLVHLYLGVGGDDRDIAVSLGLWFTTVVVTFERVFPRRWYKAAYVWAKRRAAMSGGYAYEIDPLGGRETGVAIHDGTVWWRLWASMDAWGAKGWPWLGKGWMFHWPVVAWLIGKSEYETVETGEPEAVRVHMPEGDYAATVRIDRVRWNRRWWKGRTWWRATIDVPGGIPHEGKGENAWDCGEVATYGCTQAVEEDRPLPHEVANRLAMGVLRDRARYSTLSWSPRAGWPAHCVRPEPPPATSCA